MEKHLQILSKGLTQVKRIYLEPHNERPKIFLTFHTIPGISTPVQINILYIITYPVYMYFDTLDEVS